MTPHSIPSSDEVRAAMHGLPRIALAQLSRLCGVSIHTLIKIRDGKSTDPGIDTVRKLWPHLPLLQAVFIVPTAQAETSPKTRPGRAKTTTATGTSSPGT